MNENALLGMQMDKSALERRAGIAQRSMTSAQSEIADIENIIKTGDYAGWLSDKLGGIGSEEEGRAKIAKLKEQEAAAAKELELTGRGLMATSANIQTLNVKNAELTESIEELRKAIKDGTAGGLVIQDNSSTSNNGGGTTNNNIIDTTGSNDVNDQYQVQPVG